MGNVVNKDNYDTTRSFADKLSLDSPIIIAFLSPACGLCKSLEPEFIQKTLSSNIQAAKINSHDTTSWAPEMLAYNIESVPCFVLLDKSALTAIIFTGKQIHRRHTCRPFSSDDENGYSQPIYSKPLYYLDSNEMARHVDTCAETADFPQIALLFLVKGSIPHESMWSEWFSFASGKIPLSSLCKKELTSPSSHRHQIYKACSSSSTSSLYSQHTSLQHSILDQQHLFDVWVHPDRNFTNSPESIFAGKEIPQQYRVDTVWGTHTLVDATRALMAAALTNPRNTKFVLVSESDVPLYNPLVMYQQLVQEEKSRLNACNTTKGWDTEQWQRFRHDMRDAGLSPELWRKSWQWVVLTREHAQLMVDDTRIDDIFRKTCRQLYDYDWCMHRVCYSDEHYLGTLLASMGKDNETDCVGELTDRDWSRVLVGDPHPYEYQPHEVTPSLLSTLRHGERPGCVNTVNVSTAVLKHFIDTNQDKIGSTKGFWESFEQDITIEKEEQDDVLIEEEGIEQEEEEEDGLLLLCSSLHKIEAERGESGSMLALNTQRNPSELSHEALSEEIGKVTYQIPPYLGPRCPLLARKFVNETVPAVLSAVLPCSSSSSLSHLSIVNHVECSGDLDVTKKRQRELLRQSELELIDVLNAYNIRMMNTKNYYSLKGMMYALFVMIAIGGMGFVLYKKKKQSRRTLPLAHRDSFYSLLKAYGAIE